MKSLRILGVGFLVLALVFVLVPSAARAASFLEVNSADDLDDGVCDSIHCSLREAIRAANASPTSDVIGFDIPGSERHTIQPNSPLPAIGSDVTIDATGEITLSGPPGVVLDGSFAIGVHPQAAGLEINGENSMVRGLAITRFYDGIVLQGSYNHVEATFIGNDGWTALPNTHAGIAVYAPWNVIGGDQDADAGIFCISRFSPCNVISGNGEYGVLIDNADHTIVGSNFIGTDVSGLNALPNGVGVQVTGNENQIGISGGYRNIISGSRAVGVFIAGGVENSIEDNYIGTDRRGTAPLPNGEDGIVDRGQFTTVRRNLVSGNLVYGIHIEGDYGALGTVIQANRIGTAAGGPGTIPNRYSGLVVTHPNQTLIGGMDNAAGNVIAGHNNDGAGIVIFGLGGTAAPFPAVTIWGNTIADNTVGITVSFVSNIAIGGDLSLGQGNVLVRNRHSGVIVYRSSGTVIRGNLIGIWPDGSAGANGTGITIQNSSGNTIGGTSDLQRNIIAKNNGTGVVVLTDSSVDVAENNLIQWNSIYENGFIGIDLGWRDSVTPNDTRDPDGGPNQLQNFPVLNSALIDIDTVGEFGGLPTIEGELNSRPRTDYRIEFFANDACDPFGHGEGKRHLGFVDVRTDAQGDATFNMLLEHGYTLPDEFITATATDIARSETSEFSVCIAVSLTTNEPITAAIEDVVAQVDGLVDSGNLAESDARSLTTLLDVAADQVERGNMQAAAAQMRAFIRRVDQLVDQGRLDAALAAPLVEGAQQIIGLIEHP